MALTSLIFGHGEFEDVRMFAAFDDDVHLAPDADECAIAAVWDNGNGHLWLGP